MEDKQIKKENVWTTENIRQECSNWNLDADVELLKHLQQFSQKLLLDTHTTLKSLDVLESELNTTYVKFSTVSNSFLSLSDTQFVENRVYEDEETSSNLAVTSKKPEETSEQHGDEVILQRLKEAMNNGFKVLNDKFERIKVPESDSEDEEDSSIKNEMVLKPMNPYEDLVLPYLIGSPEFNSDDTVGLEDVPSEDEMEDALSESDKDSESEDSEPESDQSKVHQTIKDQDDIFKYNQANLAGQLSPGLEDSSDLNILNSKSQKLFGTTDNKNLKDTTSEIKASLVKENNSRAQSFSSSSSSNEFVSKSVSSSYQDDRGLFFSNKDETDNLFQSESSFKPQKVPAGGISVLRPGVQLPATKIISQQTTEKLKESDQKNNTSNGLQPEDDEESPELFKSTSVSKSGKSNYDDDEEEDGNLFSQIKKPVEEDDLFCNFRSNSSKFNSASNSDLKKSFWLGSEKNIIDDGDNIFDSKGIFSDDDDELFSASKQTQSVDKKGMLSGKSKISSVTSKQSSKVNFDDPNLLTENDIFSTNKSSSSADFVDNISGAESNNTFSKITKDNLFDDLFDDFNDDDDLFKDILPSKNVTATEKNIAHGTTLKKRDEIKLIDTINNQDDMPKQTENIKSLNATDTGVLEQTEQKIREKVSSQNTTEQILSTEKVSKQNISAEDSAEQIRSVDEIDNQKIHNINLNPETKPVSSVIDFEAEDSDNDLFAEPNQSFLSGSKFKDDVLRKEVKLFDDFGSDEDLFSTSKSSVNTKSQSISVIVSQGKKPVKDLFEENDFKLSYNDEKMLFKDLENISDKSTLFSEITVDKIQSEQSSIMNQSEVKENSISASGNKIANITPSTESIFEVNTGKPDTLLKPNNITTDFFQENLPKKNLENNSVINLLEPSKTLNIRQSTVKSDVIKSSEDKPDGSVLSSSLRPSPGKLSTELTKNIDPTTLLPGSRPKFIKQEELPSTDTVCTLQSVVKERPKIQVKRRPPSRRARQEAIRASKLEGEEYSEKSEVINNKLDPINYLSPSADEENLFMNSNFDNKDRTPNSLDIFGTPTEHSSDISSDKPFLVNEEPNKNESSQTVSEYNLFSDVETVKTKENKPLKHGKKITEETVSKLVVQKESKNIFDDESDDDIFGVISKTQKSLTASKLKTVDVGDEWLNNEIKENEDFLFAQNVTSTSSQSKTLKSSQVQTSLIKEDKSKTIIQFEESDIFKEDNNTFDTEFLFFENKESKKLQTPKTNFLFDDEDGDDDIFNQSINCITSQETKPKIVNETGTHTKTSGHSAQKVKLSSQQVFTDPLMLMQND